MAYFLSPKFFCFSLRSLKVLGLGNLYGYHDTHGGCLSCGCTVMPEHWCIVWSLHWVSSFLCIHLQNDFWILRIRLLLCAMHGPYIASRNTQSAAHLGFQVVFWWFETYCIFLVGRVRSVGSELGRGRVFCRLSKTISLYPCLTFAPMRRQQSTLQKLRY